MTANETEVVRWADLGDMSPHQYNEMIDMFKAHLEGNTEEAVVMRHSVAEGETLGDAVFAGFFEDGSPEWHEFRKGGIGGSDVAGIMGIRGAFKSAYMLWQEKMGNAEAKPFDNPGLLEWGHRHEPTLATKFQEGHDEYEYLHAGSWVSSKHDWMKANPDGLLLNKDTGEIDSLVEFKTSPVGSGWGPVSEGQDGVPLKYVAQVRHYLHTFGFKQAIICVLIAGHDYREYPVYADPEFTGRMVSKCEDFLRSMAMGAPPHIDGRSDTYEWLREQNPSIDPKGEVEVPQTIMDMVTKRNSLKAEYEEAELLAKGHLLAHMGTAKKALFGERVIATREARGEAVPFVKFK